MDADTAHGKLLVDNSGSFAQLGGADGGLLPRRTTADHHEIEFSGLHFPPE